MNVTKSDCRSRCKKADPAWVTLSPWTNEGPRERLITKCDSPEETGLPLRGALDPGRVPPGPVAGADRAWKAGISARISRRASLTTPRSSGGALGSVVAESLDDVDAELLAAVVPPSMNIARGIEGSGLENLKRQDNT